MSTLRVDFADEITHLEPGERITFGRQADIDIDTNKYLHRSVGAFEWVENSWWLVNTGSAIVLEVSDLATASRLSVAPGAAVPIPFAESLVRFQAGKSTYQIAIEQVVEDRQADFDDHLGGDTTVTSSSVPLNREQRLLLAGLAQHRLADPAASATALATNREVADSLGWGKTKFDRKLDNLCQKFNRRGVAGLVGSQDSSAAQRRQRLVDHVLIVGLIDKRDLEDFRSEAS